MATPAEIQPTLDQPKTSAISAAKPLSAAEFQQELSRAPRKESPPKETVPEGRQPDENVRTEKKEPSRAPDFMEGIRKRVMEPDAKPDTKVEPMPEAKKKDAVPEKKEAVAEKKAEPAAKVEATPAEDDVPVEERGVLPHDSDRVRKRINYFVRTNTGLTSEVTKLKKELDEAKKQPATAANVEEVAALKAEHQKAQDELMRFRRLHDIDSDTEFKARFDEPVKRAETTIEETFKRYGLGEGTIKAIQAEGGFAAFSRSQKTFNVQEVDPDDPSQTKTVPRTAAELARNWLNSMNVADAEDIKASIGKQQLLQSEKKQAVEKAVGESKQYFEAQTATQRKAQEATQAEQERLKGEYAAWSHKTESETDWLKDQPIPDGAEPEVAKQIEERNAFNKELRESLKTHPKTALEYGQMKLEAAEARHLKRTMAEKDAEIERLSAQLQKKAAAQRTTNKGGSLLVKDGHKPEDEKPAAGSTDFMSGINKRMAKLAGGGEE